VKYVFIAAIAAIIARGILGLINPSALNAPERPKPEPVEPPHVQVSVEGPVATISGRVIDAKTGEPLVGASVIVEGTEIGEATDARGEYVIARVPTGTHKLRASYTGYYDLTTTVALDSITGLRVEFHLALPKILYHPVE